ncbi:MULTISPECIES: glycosyltransferase [Okeania]|uniref:glycosyltransferase n=1 Tax=Okeania TaxID=1458928 RepID=UPI000F5351C4|nr:MULTISPECIES: glycosyltransferase [Okeania]NET13483.1 glycosyltransferase family 4 protein [Okeania sp. SIO1H6]NES78853.1 glycosyltransferase family 4 protein [Okeania sp. SIO1H4]NES89842.1 glycosyltransferase family 4 protein [Okeania sp. SIO2B9]NET22827.1 glycosyltransferase family 4 protein [Okeania sp. SIO1H5]NET77208.1 glycosyltransferase family 4 protein [Okeania sp. SIO1F9]
MKIIAWPAFKTRYKNPYNWLLYSQVVQQGLTVTEFSFGKLLRQYYDIFHLHWPTETIVRHPNLVVAGLRAVTMLLAIDWVRVRGTKVIWTIHDQYPHNLLHPKLAHWFQSELIKRVDGCISHCQVSKELADATFPRLSDRPHAVIPHGHYREVYPNNINCEVAKTNLDVPFDSHVLLFLGYIDYYKNVPHLVRVFRELAPANWILLVAGKLEVPEIGTQISQVAENDSRVKLKFEFVPDEKLQEYFQTADLVILPFQEILNSGSALLALSFDCPILVPNKGAMAELQEQVGQDWVKLYPGDLTKEILESGLEWAVKEGRSPQANLEQLGWQNLSQQTIEYFEYICTHKNHSKSNI